MLHNFFQNISRKCMSTEIKIVVNILTIKKTLKMTKEQIKNHIFYI